MWECFLNGFKFIFPSTHAKSRFCRLDHLDRTGSGSGHLFLCGKNGRQATRGYDRFFSGFSEIAFLIIGVAAVLISLILRFVITVRAKIPKSVDKLPGFPRFSPASGDSGPGIGASGHSD